jgi:hypothetical protein
LKMHFNIIFPSTPKFSKWTLSFRFPRQKPACILLLSHTNRPSHPLDKIILIIPYLVNNVNYF